MSFWAPLPNFKIKTVDLTVKKVTVKAANEKMVTIGADRDLFGRLLLATKLREVDLKDVLSFELSSVPFSLEHTDGSLRKTTKSVLLSILESDEAMEPRLPKCPDIPVANLIDGMALIQATKSTGAAALGDLATKYFEDCQRVDIVFDQYWNVSIKNAERRKRGETHFLEIVINGPSTPVPKQKFMPNTRNKVGRGLVWRNFHKTRNLSLVEGLGMGSLRYLLIAIGICDIIKRRQRGSRHRAFVARQ